MEKALFLAKKAADADEVPIGAVIIQNEKVIAEAYNQRERLKNPLAHAEILAIEQASRFLQNWRLTNCLLVVTLEPCMMCLAAIQQSRIQEVVYGAKDPKGGALSLGYRLHEDLRSNHRFEVRHEDFLECGQILTQFFAQKRR